MKIPVYERQVQQNVQNVVDPGQEAFGVGVAQAQQQAASAMRGLADLVMQRALELQEREDARQVQEAETKFKRELDNLIYNPDSGLANRLLSDAAGVTIDFDEMAGKLRDDYLKALPGENQKLQFSLSSEGFIQSARGYMLRHETEQIRKGEENTVNEYLKVNSDDVVRDPLNLTTSMERAETALGNFIDISRPELSGQRQSLINQEKGRLAAIAINEYLNRGDAAAARELYKEYKDLLIEYSQETYYKLDGAIREAELKNVDAALKNNLTQAGNLNADFDALMQTGKTAIESLKGLGWQEEAIQLQLTTHMSQMVTSRINSLLTLNKEAGIEQARAIFDKYKENIDGDTAAKIQSTLDSAEFNIKVDALWNGGLQAHKLADGYTFDLEAIYTELEKIYSGSELEQAKQRINSLASQAEAISSRERQARQDGFYNGVSEIINTVGITSAGKQQALNLLNSIQGFTQYEIDLNRQYIERRFALDSGGAGGTGSYADRARAVGVEVDLIKQIETYEKTGQNPNEIQLQIDAAFKAGIIDDSTWKSLTLQLFRRRNDADDKRKKTEREFTMDWLEEQAMLLYPNSKERRDEFISYYYWETAGMTHLQAVELVKKGIELSGAKPLWEKDRATKIDADNEVLRFNEVLGKSVLARVADSIALETGVEIVTGADLVLWENKIGGLSGPVLTLIFNLYRLNEYLTAENINYYIKIFPDGYIREASGYYGGR